MEHCAMGAFFYFNNFPGKVLFALANVSQLQSNSFHVWIASFEAVGITFDMMH